MVVADKNRSPDQRGKSSPSTNLVIFYDTADLGGSFVKRSAREGALAYT